jgi:hypothetical protein
MTSKIGSAASGRYFFIGLGLFLPISKIKGNPGALDESREYLSFG